MKPRFDTPAECPGLGDLEEITLVLAESPHHADGVAVAPVFAASFHLAHLNDDVVVRCVDPQFHEQHVLRHASALDQPELPTLQFTHR